MRDSDRLSGKFFCWIFCLKWFEVVAVGVVVGWRWRGDMTMMDGVFLCGFFWCFSFLLWFAWTYIKA